MKVHGEFVVKDTGRYLYETYLKIFGTVFAPSWRELTEESRTGWAKIEWQIAVLGEPYPLVPGGVIQSANVPEPEPSSSAEESAENKEGNPRG